MNWTEVIALFASAIGLTVCALWWTMITNQVRFGASYVRTVTIDWWDAIAMLIFSIGWLSMYVVLTGAG